MDNNMPLVPVSELAKPVLGGTPKRAKPGYALAGMDNQLFVSKYQLELSKKEEMQGFLEAQMREGGIEGP